MLRACVTIEGNELKWVVPISSPTRSKNFELFTVIYKFLYPTSNLTSYTIFLHEKIDVIYCRFELVMPILALE